MEKAWNHYKSSPICPLGWLFGECKLFGHSIYVSALAIPQNPPSSPAAENNAGAYGPPPPPHSVLSGPQKDTGVPSICALTPPRRLAFIRDQSCQRHCVPSMSNNRDAFNLQCQALQYCHPQSHLFLLSQIQGMKNHQGDGFEYLSDSQVHSNTAISLGVSLSFTVFKSIGAERSWAWFWG